MYKKESGFSIALNVWVIKALLVSVSIYGGIGIMEEWLPLYTLLFIFIGSMICSLPAFIVILSLASYCRDANKPLQQKIKTFLLLLLLICLLYAAVLTAGFSLVDIITEVEYLVILNFFAVAAGFFLLSCITVAIIWKRLCSYLSGDDDIYYPISTFLHISTIKNTINMEPAHLQQQQPAATNRIMIKGFITGGLILLMMIPTLFINSLIQEREARQKEIVKEVSSKWASAQTLSSPFLVVPYSYTYQASDGKFNIGNSNLILLANDVNVNGTIIPEQRPRSIYKVLLYKSELNFKGSFKLKLPADIDSARLDYANAKLCFTLSDFKGIGEDIYVDLNQQKLLLTPGLPVNDFGKTGLSVPVNINPGELAAGLPFNMQLKLKGSEQLHFIPMSSSSKFSLESAWPSPSFDGEMLPSERNITDKGFTSKWSFNQANLPFATVIKEGMVGDKKMDFGVSLVQPADQYGKTMRSVKYAILFIGLTFAFFFIIELMQKKPFHPVQYVLVGIALVIFYTLLLSISEYIAFDFAYLIAALATILLISLYAKSHFNSWKTAGIFFLLLGLLYGFIFVLIRLEDTALLVGSIGLFIVLALVMFASRSINWYGTTSINNQTPENV